MAFTELNSVENYIIPPTSPPLQQGLYGVIVLNYMLLVNSFSSSFRMANLPRRQAGAHFYCILVTDEIGE